MTDSPPALCGTINTAQRKPAPKLAEAVITIEGRFKVSALTHQLHLAQEIAAAQDLSYDEAMELVEDARQRVKDGEPAEDLLEELEVGDEFLFALVD